MADRVDHESLPLRGVVLCCTSLPQEVRIELAGYATEMGAVHNLDLTSEVTHLIVGDITTPKYRFTAKDRPDIIVLSPEWVHAVRQQWMAGGVVDVQALERAHRLPTFSGLRICVTGFQDADTRTMLEARVKGEGAEYFGDLTKQVTHLIAAAPQGEKYKFALLWGLRVVSLKWFSDSLERGMALDEALYDPMLAPHEQGRGSYKRQDSLGKRTRSIANDGFLDGASKRKFRRTASVKLNSQSQDLWNDISLPELNSNDAEDHWTNDSYRTREEHISRAKRVNQAAQSTSAKSDDPARPQGLFSGRHILIHGFSRARVERLCDHLIPNGASVVNDAAGLASLSPTEGHSSRYLLVPHAMPTAESISLPDVPDDTIVVSEWWLERCIDQKRVLAPREDALCRPFWDADTQILAGLNICSSGFSSLDFRQGVEAMKLFGASYVTQLDASVNVLVSGADKLKPEKAMYAAKHNITVVTASWLWTCLNRNSKVDLNEYLVELPKYTPLAFSKSSPVNSPDWTAASAQKAAGASSNGKGNVSVGRLSGTKVGTPSALLMKTTNKTRGGGARRSGPFVLEDDSDDDAEASLSQVQLAGPDGEQAPDSLAQQTLSPRSQPLEERSPNISPRKLPSQQVDNTKEAAPASFRLRQPDPSVGSENMVRSKFGDGNLSADLASILQRATSRSAQSTLEESSLNRRKTRPLGRNTSGMGISKIRRTASLSSRQGSVSGEAPEDGHADGYDARSHHAERAPLGTQLGYETADAAAYRIEMEKRNKGKSSEVNPTTQVARVGTVKDSEGIRAAANRAQTRQRRGKQ